MSVTTLLVKKDEMERQPLSGCHGGKGALDWTIVLDHGQDKQRHLRFLHDDVLEPHASVGIHSHEHDEEYYYIISGKGIMTLDGKTFEVEAGDIAAVFPGGSHGLENSSEKDLRVIVFNVS